MNECRDGDHIFNPDEPDADENSVTTTCACGEVVMTMAAPGTEEYVHFTFAHPDGTVYHLAQFTMRID